MTQQTDASVQALRSSIAESLRHLADRIEGGHDGVQLPVGYILYDGDTAERLDYILRVDTLVGEVEQALQPIQATANGTPVTRILRFKRFEPRRNDAGRVTEVYAYGREQ